MKQLPDHFKTDARGNAYAGDHLLVEMWDASNLADAELIERALDAAARTAGATVLDAYYHPFGEGQGVSGVTVLAESHISIHTFPEKNFVSVDIFSCKHFDSEFASEYLKKTFGMAKVESTVLDRGTEFPKTMNGATHLVRADRQRVARPRAPRGARAAARTA